MLTTMLTSAFLFSFHPFGGWFVFDGWMHGRHWLYHAEVKEVVFSVLIVANRLRKKGNAGYLEEEKEKEGGDGNNDGAEADACQAGPKKPTLCYIHNGKPLDVYCADCNVLVCAMCGLLDHRTHKFVPVEEAVGEERKHIDWLTAEAAVLPILPPEIWLFTMNLFQRTWWPRSTTTHASTKDLVKRDAP